MTKLAPRYKKPIGWRGASAEHSLAARGYAVRRKQTMVLPTFYALKREDAIPTERLLDDIRAGKTYPDLLRKYRKVDPEQLRKRGIAAMDGYAGGSALSELDKQGVDVSYELAKASQTTKERYLEVLANSQQASFLHPEKRAALRERIAQVPAR